MKRWGLRLAVAGAALAAAGLLGGCQGDTTVNNQPAESSGITVSGHGEVQVAPDLGFIEIGVTSTAGTVAGARDRAASAADAVIKAVTSNGVDSKDIQTTGISIQPNYDYSKSESPRITGYTVSNSIEAKIRKLDSMSKTLDDAVAAGGNDVRLQSIRFGVEDSTKPAQDARDKAMADAKAKADQLAKLGGVTLGAPVTISESSQSTPNTFDKGVAAAPATSGGVSTPVQAGTNTVSVDVSVRFSLR